MRFLKINEPTRDTMRDRRLVQLEGTRENERGALQLRAARIRSTKVMRLKGDKSLVVEQMEQSCWLSHSAPTIDCPPGPTRSVRSQFN